MKYFRALFVAGLLLLTADLSIAITITSSSPGNIFVSGQSIDFTISNITDTVDYTLQDYFGNQVISTRIAGHNGTTTIQLPPLNPGWYALQVHDTTTTASVSLGIVINRANAPLPVDGKIGADAASAWIVRDTTLRKPFAHLVRLAGIPWVRERLSWTETEPAPDTFTWGKYQTVPNYLSEQGIQISQVWHDTPGWARYSTSKSPFIADLRDVYRYMRTASSHFATQIPAWEIWNEPDYEFWPGLADRFAGLQKAGYFGVKDGNPNAQVLSGSLCIGVMPFARNLFECGISEYMDIFNWHYYSVPESYPIELHEYFKELPLANLNHKPNWLTESGVRVNLIDNTGILSPEGQRVQCQWIPQSRIMALSAGVDKSFFFIIPHLHKNGTQLGSLHPDLTPYPGFIALSACANILGQAEYLGEFQFHSPEIAAQIFKTKTDTIMTIWAKKKTELSIPINKKVTEIRLLNIFGSETTVTIQHGKLSVTATRETIYLIQQGNWIKPNSIPASYLRHRDIPAAKPPSRTILVGYSDIPFDKQMGAYIISPSKPFPYTIEVYNFDTAHSTQEIVKLDMPAGWETAATQYPITLQPMERRVMQINLIPKSVKIGTTKLYLRGRFGNKSISPSVSYFIPDYAELVPTKRKPIDWSKSTSWFITPIPNGSATITYPSPETVLINAQFHGADARWIYATIKFDKPIDISGYDGVAVDLETDQADANNQSGVILMETTGSQYLGLRPLSIGKHRVVYLFNTMQRRGTAALDPNLRLDLNQIAGVRLGLNTKQNKIILTATHFELVKF